LEDEIYPQGQIYPRLRTTDLWEDNMPMLDHKNYPKKKSNVLICYNQWSLPHCNWLRPFLYTFKKLLELAA